MYDSTVPDSSEHDLVTCLSQTVSVYDLLKLDVLNSESLKMNGQKIDADTASRL